MATIHIPEAEAARNFAALMAHVSAGREVVIECDAAPVAVVRPVTKKPGLMLSEILARTKAHGSNIRLDEGFGRDLEDAIASHPEPMDPPAWD